MLPTPTHVSRHEGRMTAVMRAIAARKDGAKALRVALVHGGRVFEERLLKDGALTIGESEEASFFVAGVAPHRLFAAQAGRFVLRVPREARGRVALADGFHDASQLREEMALDAETRGRLVIGDATILFQVVDMPIAASRPRLPLAVRQGLWDQIDWPLTILVVMSFLIHFGFVGSMYSDWTDPVVDENATVQGLVDLSPTITPPALLPIVDDAAPVTPSPEQHDPAPGPTQPGPRRNTRTTDANAGLVATAEQMRIGLLATLAPGNDAVEAALRRSQIPLVQLDHNDGAVGPDRELTLHASAPIAPSQRHSDLTQIGVTHGDAKDHVDGIKDAPGPRYAIDARPDPTSIALPGAERTIASLRPAFRRCYEQGLNKDSTMAGSVVVRAKIRATGEVDKTTILRQEGLSPEVAQCIAGKIELAQFDPPHREGAVLDVPVRFVQQR